MPPPKARLSDDDIDAVKAMSSIDRVIGVDVELKPSSGGQLVGLCPMPGHVERTPSFKVSPAKGTYHCFGCGASGDVFDYLRETRGFSLPDAVRHLADQNGYSLTETEPDPEDVRRRRILAALAAAQKFYADQLETPAAAPARGELTARSFTADDAHTHGCGYAPGRDALRSHLLGEGFTLPELLGAGLIHERGGRDFFSRRLLWPLQDSSGKIVGFSGRQLSPSDHPKYLNTPQTEVFHKARLLYRLHHARSVARRSGVLYVVEGYTDVMAAERLGYAAVATCGTAFTADHASLLSRTLPADTFIVFGFDGDKAGQAAMEKAWRMSGPMLSQCEAVIWPDQLDPCDLIVRGREDAFRAAAADRRPLTELLVDQIIATELGTDPTPEARSRAMRKVGELLDSCPDPVIASHYIDTAATHLGIADPTRPPVPTGFRRDGTKLIIPAPSHPTARHQGPSDMERVYLAGCIHDPSRISDSRRPADVALSPLLVDALAVMAAHGDDWQSQLAAPVAELVADAMALSLEPGEFETVRGMLRRMGNRMQRRVPRR